MLWLMTERIKVKRSSWNFGGRTLFNIFSSVLANIVVCAEEQSVVSIRFFPWKGSSGSMSRRDCGQTQSYVAHLVVPGGSSLFSLWMLYPAVGLIITVFLSSSGSRYYLFIDTTSYNHPPPSILGQCPEGLDSCAGACIFYCTFYLFCGLCRFFVCVIISFSERSPRVYTFRIYVPLWTMIYCHKSCRPACTDIHLNSGQIGGL